MNEAHLYSVTIEWDGQKPPNTWYRRLAKLALSRGSKSTLDSPLARRQQHNKTGKGVMLQEGCFLCESESLAQTIAHYALGGIETIDRKTKEPKVIKPAYVLIGQVRTITPEKITPDDRQAIDRINSMFGRRGKPLPATDWIVTCYECLKTHVDHASAVAVCPVCHGTRIEVRMGTPKQYDISEIQGKFSEYLIWVATRFGDTGIFQLPATSGTVYKPTDPRNVFRLTPDQVRPVEQPRTPLCASDLESTLALLDGICIARTRHNVKSRLEARIDAIAKFIQMGGDPMCVTNLFAEDPDHADLFDGAITLGAEYVATLLLHQTKGIK